MALDKTICVYIPLTLCICMIIFKSSVICIVFHRINVLSLVLSVCILNYFWSWQKKIPFLYKYFFLPFWSRLLPVWRQNESPGITRPCRGWSTAMLYCIQLIIQSVYYFSFSCAHKYFLLVMYIFSSYSCMAVGFFLSPSMHSRNENLLLSQINFALKMNSK